jgi:hypothetical protein
VAKLLIFWLFFSQKASKFENLSTRLLTLALAETQATDPMQDEKPRFDH